MRPSTAGEAGKRCFLALLPDRPSRQSLRRYCGTLAGALAGDVRIRWVDPAAWHLTLRFLGTSSPAQVEHLTQMLPTLGRPLPVIAARRLGSWPRRSRSRLLVLELEPDTALLHLAHRCERQVQRAGFAAESRAFRAHITLARLRRGCARPTVSGSPPAVGFATIALMQSHLNPSGAIYTSLASATVSHTAQ